MTQVPDTLTIFTGATSGNDRYKTREGAGQLRVGQGREPALQFNVPELVDRAACLRTPR